MRTTAYVLSFSGHQFRVQPDENAAAHKEKKHGSFAENRGQSPYQQDRNKDGGDADSKPSTF